MKTYKIELFFNNGNVRVASAFVNVNAKNKTEARIKGNDFYIIEKGYSNATCGEIKEIKAYENCSITLDTIYLLSFPKPKSKHPLDYISVITTYENGTTRQSSLGVNEGGCFRVIGNLSHGSEISFTKDQAKKLIGELRKIK